jgi:hypothetical protein
MKETIEQPQAWVRYAEDEAVLMANIAGLMILRNAIDDAIKNGTHTFSKDDLIEFSSIAICEEKDLPNKESVGSRLASCGCLILLAVCFLIFVFGFVELMRILF